MIVKPEQIMARVQGSVAVKPEVARPRIALGERLTDIEHRTLMLVAEGNTSISTARILSEPVETVKSRLRVIHIKLGAKDRAHAVHLAHRKGVIT